LDMSEISPILVLQT